VSNLDSQHVPVRQPGSRRLVVSVALCLPAIVGTAFFLVGVLLAPFTDYSTFDPFREPTAAERLKLHVYSGLLMVCWPGATLGPLLIPFAAHQAVQLAASRGGNTRQAVVAWVVVGLGLLATGLFWGWLINLEIVP
jgi:hypothetical protein